jgi:hypothetical protein
MRLQSCLAERCPAPQAARGEQQVDAVVVTPELVREHCQKAWAHRGEEIIWIELPADPILRCGARDQIVSGEGDDGHRWARRRWQHLDGAIGDGEIRAQQTPGRLRAGAWTTALTESTAVLGFPCPVDLGLGFATTGALLNHGAQTT